MSLKRFVKSNLTAGNAVVIILLVIAIKMFWAKSIHLETPVGSVDATFATKQINLINKTQALITEATESIDEAQGACETEAKQPMARRKAITARQGEHVTEVSVPAEKAAKLKLQTQELRNINMQLQQLKEELKALPTGSVKNSET